MIAIDTNVLIRFLIKDDKDQAQKAKQLLSEQEKKDGNILISNIVLLEVIWVLKSGYNVPKPEIINTLKKILSNNLFQFENRQLILETIQKYENNEGDFADYFIGNISKQHNASPTYTFDKEASKDNLFELLK